MQLALKTELAKTKQKLELLNAHEEQEVQTDGQTAKPLAEKMRKQLSEKLQK